MVAQLSPEPKAPRSGAGLPRLFCFQGTCLCSDSLRGRPPRLSGRARRTRPGLVISTAPIPPVRYRSPPAGPSPRTRTTRRPDRPGAGRPRPCGASFRPLSGARSRRTSPIAPRRTPADLQAEEFSGPGPPPSPSVICPAARSRLVLPARAPLGSSGGGAGDPVRAHPFARPLSGPGRPPACLSPRTRVSGRTESGAGRPPPVLLRGPAPPAGQLPRGRPPSPLRRAPLVRTARGSPAIGHRPRRTRVSLSHRGDSARPGPPPRSSGDLPGGAFPPCPSGAPRSARRAARADGATVAG